MGAHIRKIEASGSMYTSLEAARSTSMEASSTSVEVLYTSTEAATTSTTSTEAHGSFHGSSGKSSMEILQTSKRKFPWKWWKLLTYTADSTVFSTSVFFCGTPWTSMEAASKEASICLTVQVRGIKWKWKFVELRERSWKKMQLLGSARGNVH